MVTCAKSKTPPKNCENSMKGKLAKGAKASDPPKDAKSEHAAAKKQNEAAKPNDEAKQSNQQPGGNKGEPVGEAKREKTKIITLDHQIDEKHDETGDQPQTQETLDSENSDQKQVGVEKTQDVEEDDAAQKTQTSEKSGKVKNSVKKARDVDKSLVEKTQDVE
ncbi:unnamed protein product [Bursaphelenchus okinawaensis]|uniref:Uncharacterized protein n=1 Tax=Bursaphelenchus okinawaensis TaxID=465554 RepID=A0A811L8U5_9BILA|nr:unnamed protein product [Bursaphelenchus okinawaensis]CAG9118549.1 unnamed protein product [Bursaphelenchus okinawaensis]